MFRTSDSGVRFILDPGSLSNNVYVKAPMLVALLDSMIDEVGEDESHPLASPMEIVGVLIQKYDDEHVPELEVE
jgi:hypothetical protein